MAWPQWIVYGPRTAIRVKAKAGGIAARSGFALALPITFTHLSQMEMRLPAGEYLRVNQVRSLPTRTLILTA